MLTDRHVIRRLQLIREVLVTGDPPPGWEGRTADWRCNCSSLARAFECNPRTILRDIDLLRDLGYDVKYNKSEKAYYCGNAASMSTLPMMEVSDEEATALLNCLALGGAVFDKSSRKALETFIRKLEGQLPDGFIYSAIDVAGTFTYHGGHVTLEQKETFTVLQRAILDERCVKCRYYSPYNDEESDYFLEPLHLANLSGVWYLIARKRDPMLSIDNAPLRSEQLFRLNRFRSVERSNKRVKERLHPQEVSKNLDPEFGTWLSKDKAQEVILRVREHLVPFMNEISWKAKTPLKKDKNGFWRLSFESLNLELVATFVMKWAPDIQVVSPEHLRDRVIENCQQLLRLHGMDAEV